MIFEWDQNKNKINVRKHNISFKEAVQVFRDPNLLYKLDSYTEEERWDVIGLVGSVLFVVFTERDNDVIRIISARKATKGEIDEYKKNISG